MLSKLLATFLLLGIILVPSAALADEPTSLTKGIDELRNDADSLGLVKDKTINDVIIDVIVWILGFVAIIALASLIWGGIVYITSFGNDKRIEDAKKIILYAIVGILVVLLSFVVIAGVRRAVGVPDDGAFLSVPAAHAADDDEDEKGFDLGIKTIEDKVPDLGIADPKAEDDDGKVVGGLGNRLLAIINAILFFGAILALFAIVWAGITYIIALGNDEKIKQAKNIVLYAIIGLIVMGISFAIIAAIEAIFAG